MKQYNRIMLGAGSKYIDECLRDGFIGVDFIGQMDMSDTSSDNETEWRKQLTKKYLEFFLKGRKEQRVIVSASCGQYVSD